MKRFGIGMMICSSMVVIGTLAYGAYSSFSNGDYAAGIYLTGIVTTALFFTGWLLYAAD